MTAPNYTDKDEVLGITRANIVGAISSDTTNTTVEGRLAKVALELWDARDSARATAALQDEAAHKIQPRMMKLEQFLKAWDKIHSQADPGSFGEHWIDIGYVDEQDLDEFFDLAKELGAGE